jgi:hypothetical protein
MNFQKFAESVMLEGIMRAKQRNALKDKQFAYTGPDGVRKLPINDAGHIKAAMGRLNQTHGIPASQKPAVRAKIARRAAQLGIGTPNFKPRGKKK